jgi:hypothetical protein
MGKWRQARGPVSKACMNFDLFYKRSLKTRVTLFTLAVAGIWSSDSS